MPSLTNIRPHILSVVVVDLKSKEQKVANIAPNESISLDQNVIDASPDVLLKLKEHKLAESQEE